MLLEAKSTWVAPNAKRPLKEQRYIEFLYEAKNPQRKGFFYIVPKKAAAGYAELLKQHSGARGDTTLGILAWEDLLPLFSNQLVKEALGQLLNIADGLRRLRVWEEQKPL